MPRPSVFLFLILLIFLLPPAVTKADERQEALKTWITNQFHQLDTNGDGKLTPDEYAKVPWVKRLDLNHDGVVTLEEATEGLTKFAAAFGGALPGLAAPASEAPAASPREAPKTLKPGEYGIGTLIADTVLRDLAGREIKLTEYRQNRPLVVAVVSPSCPVSKRYLPTLAELQKSSTPLLLLSNATTEEEPALATALASAGLTVPCLRDADHALARTLGATASTDVFLVDRAGRWSIAVPSMTSTDSVTRATPPARIICWMPSLRSPLPKLRSSLPPKRLAACSISARRRRLLPRPLTTTASRG